jgi:hemerythrin-like domain-containing protein
MQDSSPGFGEKATADDPLDIIAREHALQLELSKSLEFIADGLPAQVDRRLVREVTAILSRGLSAHFEMEERLLFPLLRQRANDDAALVAALDQLAMEHARDDDISAELVDELTVLAEQGRARNAEMLGYMLRGYFESQRRHIEWENAVVLPAARRLLTDQDRQQLAGRLKRRPVASSAADRWG